MTSEVAGANIANAAASSSFLPPRFFHFSSSCSSYNFHSVSYISSFSFFFFTCFLSSGMNEGKVKGKGCEGWDWLHEWNGCDEWECAQGQQGTDWHAQSAGTNDAKRRSATEGAMATSGR